jgi:hypothetical protein
MMTLKAEWNRLFAQDLQQAVDEGGLAISEQWVREAIVGLLREAAQGGYPPSAELAALTRLALEAVDEAEVA